MNAKAEALQYSGQLHEAVQVYDDIVARRPNYWQAYNNLGTILQLQAKYEKAAKAFAAAAMTAPAVALPMSNLGATYIELGKLDEARAALTESLKRTPNTDAYLNLGTLEFNDKKYDSARKYYQQAASIEPSYHVIWRNLGDCYAMLGETKMVTASYQKAASLLSNALHLNPLNGNDWATLAFYDAKIGNTAGVKSDIKSAEAHGAKDVDSQFLITQALAVSGKREEALKLLLWCMDKGLSPEDVDLALDLNDLKRDPRYQAHLKKQTNTKA